MRKAGQTLLLEGLEELGIAPSARAEELSVEDYLFLSAFDGKKAEQTES